MSSSYSSTTAIRLPLIPNPNTPFPQSTSPLALCNYQANGTEQSRTEFMGSSRWNPTPEQLLALEEMYRQGTRTPGAEQIQHIAAQLRLRKTGYDVEQTKNWAPSSNCSKHTEESISMHRRAESGIGPHGWSPFDEKELHQRKSSLMMISNTVDRMNATWQTPSSSDTITTTTSLETKFLLKENFNNVDETQKTLKLFPVCRDEDGNKNVKASTSKKLETETLQIKTTSHQFIEFLPLKKY
ncbi:hypothetical protein EZV62_018534 [Acer yangbiense]|uniref:Homeobox domain-containing protein n=1 Tax=Acer yangbiense TaxID=1000413 RepID=A0A5C7HJM7_9ROSI|nr:hypothetical protein EZV62_018534 [Acer yangbiense]